MGIYLAEPLFLHLNIHNDERDLKHLFTLRGLEFIDLYGLGYARKKRN